jgi:hypothetical protein
MVQQLNKHERRAHTAEQPYGSLRVAIELDRENQTDPDARERVVRCRATEALYRGLDQMVQQARKGIPA